MGRGVKTLAAPCQPNPPRHPTVPLCVVVTAALLAAPASLSARSSASAPNHTPPAYPDAIHVNRGCYVSTAVYLARFNREFPHECAESVTVAPAGFDGRHTIAVLTWNGAWWGRDEFSGVFPLGCDVTTAPDPVSLSSRAQAVLARVARRQLGRGAIAGVAGPARLSAGERERDVRMAAALLPFRSRCYRVRCGHEDRLFLFFQPAAGQIAVYEPTHGTATAACKSTDIPTVVRAVALRLGYQVSSIQPVAFDPADRLAMR